MDKLSVRNRLAIGLATSALLMAAAVGPTLAVDTVTQTITGSGLTASVADLGLTAVPYQNAARAVTGTMVLTAADNTGAASPAGWNVTIQSSAFVWSSQILGGTDIPASAFALTSADAPVAGLDSQAVSVAAATGPQVPAATPFGTLDTARKVLHATAGYGAGTYTQNLGVTLTIPALSRVGTYTGTLTTTITSAP